MPTRSKPRRSVGREAVPSGHSVGERVRALRLARGLTQAQLAGSEVTKGFISLLETGRSGISVRAAELIAGRLGTTVGDLLAPTTGSDDLSAEITLTRAEGLLVGGRVAEALQLIRPLESRLSGRPRGRLLRLLGRALTEHDRTREAVVALDEALRIFRTGSDRELATRTLYDLALAHAKVEAHGEALTYALACEHALNSGDVVDRSLELRVLAFLAQSFVTLGETAAADLRSERARALAEDIADPRTTAELYENIAITRQRQGDFDSALRFARLANEAYGRWGSEAAIGSSWNTIGWIYIHRKQFRRASEALDRAERSAHDRGDMRLMGYVLQNRAELEIGRGNFEAALALADRAIAHEGSSARCRALSRLVRATALSQTKTTNAVVQKAFAEAETALEPLGRRLLARAFKAEFEALKSRAMHREATEAAARALELSAPVLM